MEKSEEELTIEKARQIIELDQTFDEITDEFSAEKIAQMDSETLCECARDYAETKEDSLLLLLIEELASRIEH